jgi:hypothetical protein
MVPNCYREYEEYEAKGPEADELRLIIAKGLEEAVLIPEYAAQGHEAEELRLIVAEGLKQVFFKSKDGG